MFRGASAEDYVFCPCEETWVNPNTGLGCVSKCPMKDTLNCPLEEKKR